MSIVYNTAYSILYNNCSVQYKFVFGLLIIKRHKLDYIAQVWDVLNPKFKNCIIDLKVTTVKLGQVIRLYCQTINICLGKPAYRAKWWS